MMRSTQSADRVGRTSNGTELTRRAVAERFMWRPCPGKCPRFEVESVIMETDDEAIEVHAGTDHRGTQGASGWCIDGGSVPQARDQRADVLHVAFEIRRDGSL